ncbi:MAG: DUF3109 family protein [Bacteroidales bacterium]|nr:DUF3109 family protein [Bacteroidales bacterium]
MLIVGNSIISDDIIHNYFCCNIEQCNGMCCVEGDFGAPITHEEKRIIKKLLPKIIPHLPLKAQQTIKDKNFFTYDDEGNLVTQIIDGKDCVFAFKSPENYTYCIFQKLYIEKKSDFIKPISCHLYPIRISEYDEMTALNFHQWDVCQSALLRGREKNIRIYENCKEALIRRFGQKWYDELLDEINKMK